MDFTSSRQRHPSVRTRTRHTLLALALLVILGAACVSTGPAAAAGFMTANRCQMHQAFVEGDDAGVGAHLPKAYTPVRTSSGAPLLFVRTISCEAVGLDGAVAPGVMASFGVVIDSPDGLGCASASPVGGSTRGDNPPICNWYPLSWLADDPRVVAWLRDGTPAFPARHVPGLKFELEPADPAQGGAPFRFRTPASAPSPFSIEAVGREHPGALVVRGGYWFDAPAGTIKIPWGSDNLTGGDANGTVTAAPGSLLATLMGAEQRSYTPEFASFVHERWQEASYRKQNLAPAPAADRFEGSCAFEGLIKFKPAVTNTPGPLVYDWAGEGACTGTLNGQAVSEIAAKARQRGQSHGSCRMAYTTQPGQGAITFPGGEVIRYTQDFRSMSTEVDLQYYGERSGFARGHATFLTDRTSPDITERCTVGLEETPLDVEMSTESPLVSEPVAARPRLKVGVEPKRVRPGRRRAFRFRVSDADGRPTAGALVRFAGRRARTGARGRARIVAKLKRVGRHRARVSKRGFRGARAIVIVRRT